MKYPGKFKFWTLQELQAEAAKYSTRNSFKDNSTNAYQSAWRHGLLDQICSHIVKPDPVCKWTFDDLCREASRYKRRTDFAHCSSAAYQSAMRRNLLDEICSHMKTHQQQEI